MARYILYAGTTKTICQSHINGNPENTQNMWQILVGSFLLGQSSLFVVAPYMPVYAHILLIPVSLAIGGIELQLACMCCWTAYILGHF